MMSYKQENLFTSVFGRDPAFQVLSFTLLEQEVIKKHKTCTERTHNGLADSLSFIHFVLVLLATVTQVPETGILYVPLFPSLS